LVQVPASVPPPEAFTPSTHAKQFDRPARDARALAHRRRGAGQGFRPELFADSRPVTGSRRARSVAHHPLRGAGAISFSHFLNDLIQSLIIAIYPLLKGEFRLSFAQIGAITLTYQICASVLQPLVGAYTDKHPQPYSLSMGMASTLIGLVTLAFAPNYACVLVAAAFVGAGSAVFHPESSRIARLASGGQHGLAQSIFQVGGSAGSAIGPLLAALIVIPHGQRSVAWFALAAILAIVVLWKVSGWYKRHHLDRRATAKARRGPPARYRRGARPGRWPSCSCCCSPSISISRASRATTVSTSWRNSICRCRSAQLYLFLFLLAVAVGGLIGGPVGDRIGRKRVIWFSILGVAPFTLLLPHVGLAATAVLERDHRAHPGLGVLGHPRVRAGDHAGPGGRGVGAVLRLRLRHGRHRRRRARRSLADREGIEFVYRLCAFLPLLGVAAALLPNIELAACGAARDPEPRLADHAVRIAHRGRQRASWTRSACRYRPCRR
jgi:FSR family fosmidomycin resistance protein-like MFS transporter